MENRNVSMLTFNMENFKLKKINFSDYEISFRRWLISEIDSKNMSFEDARDRFQLCGKEYKRIIKKWQEHYSEELHVSLSFMSSKDRSDNKKLEQRIKELEKQLEKAKMKNIALDTLIDVAETEFKIPIRKKPGPKQ